MSVSGGEGMRVDESVSHGIPVSQIRVETEQGTKALCRGQGRYITLDLGAADPSGESQGCVRLLRACLKSFDKNGGVGDNRKKQAGAGENASIPK